MITGLYPSTDIQPPMEISALYFRLLFISGKFETKLIFGS